MIEKNITIPLTVAKIARRGVKLLLVRWMDEPYVDGMNVWRMSRSAVDEGRYVGSLTAAAKTINEKIKEAQR